MHTAGIDPSANHSATCPYVVDDGSTSTTRYRSLLSRPSGARSEVRGVVIDVADTPYSHLEVIIFFSFASSSILYLNLLIIAYIN